MNCSDRDGLIWYDGKLVPWKDATTHVLTYTLHYGVGCFEGIRAYASPRGTAVFRLEEHTQRLFNSAKLLGMKIAYTPQQVNEAALEVLRANGFGDSYIRPMAFYGAEGMGLRTENFKVHLVLAAWPWDASYNDNTAESGIRVKTSTYSRHHVNASLCRAKANANYLNSMLALNEAFRDGYDGAVMLDPHGFIAEGAVENIFLVQAGALHTPDVTSALDGITRRTILQLAEDAGIRVYERRLTRDELHVSDEAFFTGTSAEVMPIREADGCVIGSGRCGPITGKLQRLYRSHVRGEGALHPAWVTLLPP